jgi:biotin carboxyl carrier protein
MPTRLRLSDDERTWVTEVSGGEVLVSGAGALTVREEGDGRFIVARGDATVAAGVALVHGRHAWVAIDGDLFAFEVGAGGAGSAARDHGALAPPMPATVVRLAVKPGDRVAHGDTLIVLEAMKMELPVRAPRDGIVGAIHCQEGELVQPGTTLVELV